MKKITITFILLGIYFFANAQKEDYNWLSGDYDPNSNAKNIFKFNDLGLESIDTVVTDANFYITNSSISDSLGNLLFYTNGRKIYNAQHQVIENGDSLNYNWYWNNSSFSNNYGLFQGCLILPDINKSDTLWYIFHSKIDTISPQLFLNEFYVANTLNLTQVVRRENGSLSIRSKNEIIINDTMFVGNLTACKHGNGRDWWIFASEGKSNCIYQLLLSPSGIQIFDTVCAGLQPLLFGAVGLGVFSPDGTKYIKAEGINGIDIYDFDRCNGNLILKESIIRDSILQNNALATVKFWGRIAVSSNSKYLYVATVDSLYQFNLNSNSIVNSKELVRGLDWNSVVVDLEGFVHPILASDGRIYISSDIVKHYHVINNPDTTFQYVDLVTKIPLLVKGSLGMPNFPNYRLGPLTGSACDTLGVGIQEIKESFGFLVKPNPASTFVEIDYGNFPWQSSSQASLHIYNLLGELVYSQNLPQYSGKRILDIQNFVAGVYVLQINDNGNLVGTEKLVVYR
jgi:hypothetical protein